MEEQLVAIFCDVDDFCNAFEADWRSFSKLHGLRKRFRRDALALSELMTIAGDKAHKREFRLQPLYPLPQFVAIGTRIGSR